MWDDLINLDFEMPEFEMPDTDWATALADYDFGDFGGDLFFDTDTGEFVDPGAVDPSSVVDLETTDYDFGEMPNEPLPTSPTSTSKSDILRSMEGAPAGTTAPGREEWNWMNMADPTASIASAQDSGWLKAGLQGLSGLMSAFTGGGAGANALKGLAETGGGGLLPATGLPGYLSASVPQVGGGSAPDIARAAATMAAPGSGGGGVGDAADLLRAPSMSGLEMQDPLSAALMHLQAEGGPRVGLQAPIDPGDVPAKFTPLAIPATEPGSAASAMPSPRISGLQRLMAERFG